MNYRVLPGSGLKNVVDKAETCNSSVYDKQVHTTDIKRGTITCDVLDMSSDILSDNQPNSKS